MRLPVIIALVLALSVAADRAQTPDPAAPAAAPNDAAIHGYGDRDKTCMAWTDTCRSCERGEGEAVHCSNIGIACEPAAITCTTRQAAPAK